MKILVIVAMCMTPLLAFGMLGNLLIILVTAKFKQLHHRNGILVAIIAFFDFISEIHETKNAVEIFMGKSLMRRDDCYRTIFFYTYSFNMSNVSILFLAIDRLIAVLLPFKYQHIRSKRFIAIALVIGFVYSTPFVVTGFFVADDTVVEPCNPPMSFSPLLLKVYNYCSASMATLVVLLNTICYLIMRNVGKKRHLCMASAFFSGSEQDDAYIQRHAQMTRSLLVMMAAYSSTTLLGAFILATCNILPITKQTVAEVASFVCLLVLLNYGCSFYILLWRSRVYREIFFSQFHRNSTISVVPFEGTHSKTIQKRNGNQS